METTKWALDPTHSDLGFKIRHLMIANVSGSIRNFKVEANTNEDDFASASIRLTADMNSIDTNNTQRDAHLRTSDFFEIEKYPELQFRSTRMEKLDDDNYVLHGDLSLRGVTKPVKLDVEYSGITTDPWGGERAGFTVTGKIRRSDWGVNFNTLLETGNFALGEEVKISAELQMVKVPVVEAV